MWKNILWNESWSGQKGVNWVVALQIVTSIVGLLVWAAKVADWLNWWPSIMIVTPEMAGKAFVWLVVPAIALTVSIFMAVLLLLGVNHKIPNLIQAWVIHIRVFAAVVLIQIGREIHSLVYHEHFLVVGGYTDFVWIAGILFLVGTALIVVDTHKRDMQYRID